MRPRLWPWLCVLLPFAAAWLLADARVRGLLITTLAVSTSAAALATILGTFLAVVFLRTNLPGRSLGPWLLGGLLFLPLYVHIAGWETVLGKFGWWTTFGGTLDSPLLTGWFATIWIHAVAGLPWVVLFVAAGLASVDPAWEEIALCEMPWPSVLRTITLPAIAPFVLLAALWVGMLTAGEMTVTNIYQVRTYAEEIYTNFAHEGTALVEILRRSLPGFMVLGAIAAAIFLLLKDVVPATTIGLMHPPQPWDLQRSRGPIVIITWLLLAVLILVPLVSLFYETGGLAQEINGKFVRGWSLSKAASVVLQAPANNWPEAQSTVAIALAAAFVTVVLVSIPAWRAGRSGRVTAPWLMMLPALIPGPLVGIAVITLLNRPEDPTGVLTTLYDRTLVPPMLAVLPRTIPIVGLILWSSFRQTPRDLRDMAALQARWPWSEACLLIRGLHGRAMVAAFLAAAAVAAGDLACSILVLPPDFSTIAFRVFQELHSGSNDRLSAMCLVQFAITAILGGGVAWLLSRAAPIKNS